MSLRRLTSNRRRQLHGLLGGGWVHPRVAHRSQSFVVGDGSEDDFEQVLALLERLLAAPTPESLVSMYGFDPQPSLLDSTVSAIESILDSPRFGELESWTAYTNQLLLQLEPTMERALAILAPSGRRHGGIREHPPKRRRATGGDLLRVCLPAGRPRPHGRSRELGGRRSVARPRSPAQRRSARP